MLSTIVAFFVKIGLGGMIDKGIGYLDRKADREFGDKKLRYQFAAEHVRQAVEETRVMADYNKAKLEHKTMWFFLAMFIVPLGFWWCAVILDSVFHFSWDVADLPTPQMQQWAGDMIRWLFYVGSGVAAFKMVTR